MQPEELRQLLANNLRRLAERKGLGLNALADKIGMSRGTVHYIATAQVGATIDSLAKLAGGLGVPPSRLLAEAKATKPRARAR